MKSKFFSILYLFLNLFLITFASNSLACHKGDFGSSGKSHHKWGKNVGIFQFTENVTISVSTTTSCDFYTAFLDSQYDFIQEQVAYGYGAHLDALAMINGCEDQVKAEFSKTLSVNYFELFGEIKNPQALRNGIEKLIGSNSTLNLSCRKV